MNSKVTILVPESELPAEGADPPALADDRASAPSDLLEVYAELLASSALSFEISPTGAVNLGDTPERENLLALDISGEAGADPTLSLSGDAPKTHIDLADLADSITESFDAEDSRRQVVTNLASNLRTALGEDSGSPIPLVHWYRPAEGSDGVLQLLGIWLADGEQLESLRESGSEGIIFDEAEIEGRGLRETLTAFTILGVMLGGTLEADAGLFKRWSKKKAAKNTQTVTRSGQAPPKIDRDAISKIGAGETMVIVDVSKQRAYLLARGRIVVDTPVSTARAGKYTPRGEFKITQRVEKGKTSSIYGCALPYWMRLDQSAIGMHIGELPGYPASAGCIRLPAEIAPVMFEMTKSGTTVKVMSSWQPDAIVASN